jgi:hypothetical protein
MSRGKKRVSLQDNTKPDQEFMHVEQAMSDIKDCAVMLTMARNYLCEDVFIKKTGLEIEASIDFLAESVKILKKRLVGKPTQEINLDERLEGIKRIARRMKSPDEDVRAQCTDGVLGSELWAAFNGLVPALNALKTKLEGRPIAYRKKDSMYDFLGRLREGFRKILRVFPVLSKISAVTIAACFAVFGFLFITMETDKDLLEQIDQQERIVRLKQSELRQVHGEMGRLQETIEGLRNQELSRQEKIKIMDLSMQAHNLTERAEKIETELESANDALKENLRNAEAIKGKSFLSRLLRQ